MGGPHISGFIRIISEGRYLSLGNKSWRNPKRSNKSLKKRRALEANFHEATCVGYTARSNEHIVILSKGGPAMRSGR